LDEIHFSNLIFRRQRATVTDKLWSKGLDIPERRH